MTALIVAHEVACFLLLASVFGRLVRTDDTTIVAIRFSFFVLGGLACFGVVAPLLCPKQVTWFGVAVLYVLLLLQVSTSRHWKFGVPYSYIMPDHRAERRQCQI